jgi:hypothetical protein
MNPSLNSLPVVGDCAGRRKAQDGLDYRKSVLRSMIDFASEKLLLQFAGLPISDVNRHPADPCRSSVLVKGGCGGA